MNCPTGKIEHTTVTAAQAHADSIFRKDGHQPNVYVCSQCGFFHIGGGRASDRPAYRPVPIVTSPKPIFVQKKIDKGHAVTLEDLILEKLRGTFLTDVAIAKQLSSDLGKVERLRLRNKIPNSFQRQRNAVVNLLAAQPGRSRTEIAKALGISDWYVKAVVKELGLAGTAKHKSGRRGVKHPNFGKHLPKELREKIAEHTQAEQSTPEWRAKASVRTKVKNNLPKDHKALSDAANKRWAKRKKEVYGRYESIARFVETSKLSQARVAALFGVSQGTVCGAVQWHKQRGGSQINCK